MAPEAVPTPDSMPRAMTFMVLSGLCFALMGAGVKWAGDVPVPTKVFFRALVTLAVTLVIALGIGFLFWDERPDALALTGGALIIGAAVWTHQVTRRVELGTDRNAA